MYLSNFMHIGVGEMVENVFKHTVVTYMRTPVGGSQTHSPVMRLAYIGSPVRGSIISTHSHLHNSTGNMTLVLRILLLLRRRRWRRR